MSSTVFCPISFHKIDENIARLNGLFTTLIVIISGLTGSILPLIFLIIDFFARSIPKPAYSILAIFSKWVSKTLKFKKLPINAGPKIFAARIGLLFSVLSALFMISGLETAALATFIVFGICTFLEAAFGFCVACKIYPFVYKISQIRPINKIKNLEFKDFEI